MTRANRYFTSGNIRHIVHRCHKKEFLLKFKRDRDRYLMQCLVYFDLNMVRADVVSHPKDWLHGGYFELLNPTTETRIQPFGR